MVSLTKREEKLIISLQQKKFRKSEGLFVVEGVKMVKEAITSNMKVKFIVSSFPYDNSDVLVKHCEENVINKLSSFKTSPGILAVLELPNLTSCSKLDSKTTLLIEKVQDPGNLGTIVRTAEALGIKQMICSPDCVDLFSPKVVQSTMGSIFRMHFAVKNLVEFIAQLPSTVPIYAAHLNGENLYQSTIDFPNVLIVGNESKGISEELSAAVTKKIKIPMEGEAESFNVSIATAIILGEFSRQLV